jgi:murein DD-endopeptidase MepM/ murein hydrolase activator NlpD
MTSAFGNRANPVGQGTQFHPGIDIVSNDGARVPVLAAAAGTVVRVDYPAMGGGYGFQVIIDHGLIDGARLYTQYAHLHGPPKGTRVEDSSICVKRGEVVKAGQQIALMGNTGVGTGIHLHFEVRRNSPKAHSAGGEVANPLTYLKA